VNQRDVLSGLLDATPDAMVIVDADGIMVHANGEAERMFGYRRGDLIGKSVEVLVPEALRAAHADYRAAYVAGPDLPPVKVGRELTARRRDGTILPVEINLKALPLDGGRHVVAALRDITERKQAEAELRALLAELEDRNRELDAFGHTVAHDLRSPLSGIVGYLEMIREAEGEQLSSFGHQLVNEAVRSADKMGQIIDSLLLLAQLRDASHEIGPVPMKPVIGAALERLRAETEARGVTVVVEDDLPPVMGHGPWLEEVLANLIGNAVKYAGLRNPDPHVAIRARREPGTVRYEVSDNGMGINPQDQARAFEMFSRFHSGHAEGLGLGLSIVQRIVAKLNGQVGVESALGQGSTFWFSLPAAGEET
jgi:PAS domain S-box-containing protein